MSAWTTRAWKNCANSSAIFLSQAEIAAVNLDDAESAALAPRARAVISFAIDNPQATLGVMPGSITEHAESLTATLIDRRSGATFPLTLQIPGRHNLANALAAIAGSHAAGVPVAAAVAALVTFLGLARRFDHPRHQPRRHHRDRRFRA